MKFFDSLSDFDDLMTALLFALALIGLGSPLFITTKKTPAQEIGNAGRRRNPEDDVLVESWTSLKANGLTKYHFKNENLYFEVWAKDLRTAVVKFKQQLPLENISLNKIKFRDRS